LLPKNPSAHIGRALHEFNALTFAGNDRAQSERSPCNGEGAEELTSGVRLSTEDARVFGSQFEAIIKEDR